MYTSVLSKIQPRLKETEQMDKYLKTHEYKIKE
jgi:hypothetical protein